MMEFAFLKHLELLILPPGSLLVLILIGLIVLRYSKRWGVSIITTAFILFYAISMPMLSNWLLASLENYPPLTEEQVKNTTADAIVVLAGGRLSAQPEYGGDTVSESSLQRLRYAAWLKRRTNLPLIVSGGSTKGEVKAESELMQETLQKEFNVEVNSVEKNSKTTYENAKNTAEQLKQAGHKKILLVTHAFHMLRSVEAFQQFGIEVIPAPTVYTSDVEARFPLMKILPNSNAAMQSYSALHELYGRLWYRLRYY